MNSIDQVCETLIADGWNTFPDAGFIETGHVSRRAVAPTLEAAALLARIGDARPVLECEALAAVLDPLPLSALMLVPRMQDALKAGLERMQEIGGARLGDRTMIDALQPALEALPEGLGAPASQRDLSKPPNALRGVWHSPQWPGPSTRYCPARASAEAVAGSPTEGVASSGAASEGWATAVNGGSTPSGRAAFQPSQRLHRSPTTTANSQDSPSGLVA